MVCAVGRRLAASGHGLEGNQIVIEGLGFENNPAMSKEVTKMESSFERKDNGSGMDPFRETDYQALATWWCRCTEW